MNGLFEDRFQRFVITFSCNLWFPIQIIIKPFTSKDIGQLFFFDLSIIFLAWSQGFGSVSDWAWLRDNNISVDNLGEEDVIFGKFDIAEDFLLFNHILLLGKFYIYSRKYQNGIPSLQGFIARTRRIYNIELHIARKRDKLNNHFRKWEKVISVFTNK